MPFPLAIRATVVAIREHNRTIHGRRDPVTGASMIEKVNLGWFMHLDFGGGGGALSFPIGHERPTAISEGDSIVLRFAKE